MSLRAVIDALRPRLKVYRRLARFFWSVGERSRILPTQVLLVCHDADRGYVHEGKRYAQVLDSLNERIVRSGISTLTIAAPFSEIAGDLAYGNVVAANGIFARAIVLQMLTRKRGLHKNPVVDAWERLLERVRPGVIIAIQPTIELCIAAQRRRVWIADLQHGIMSDEGYYHERCRRALDQAGWPDEILCWDENSVKWVRRRSAKYLKARVIGNPWFVRFMSPCLDDALVRAAAAAAPARQERPTILVALQWGMERTKGYHETGMPLALYTFMVMHGRKYVWWLRVHPMLMHGAAQADTYQHLERAFVGHDNVAWAACSEAPLPLVLPKVDLHMTSHSSVVLEASWFGIRSALLHGSRDLLMDWFGDQIESGSADVVRAEEAEIARWIERNVPRSRGGETSAVRSAAALEQFIDDLERRVNPASHRRAGLLADAVSSTA
jgi:hypothetical protein